MKNGRLFQILFYLVEKRRATAKELAEEFEVSERTIYRDVDILSSAGIPIYAQKGPGGGIRLMDQYVLDRTLLSEQQQEEILCALQAILATRGSEERETLDRLSGLFRRSGLNWVDVDFSHWGSGEREREVFSCIKKAVFERKRLSFDYHSSAGVKSHRQVEPARVIFKEGCWYLQAFCCLCKDWRLFRLVRMNRVEMEEERFFIKNPPEYALERPEVPKYAIRMRVQPQAVWRVRDCFSQDQIMQETEGSFLVEFFYPENEFLMDFLMSFGSRAEVLSPVHIRQAIMLEAKNLAESYKE